MYLSGLVFVSIFLISRQIMIFAASKLESKKLILLLPLVFILMDLPGHAQKINLGLHVEPFYSWLTTNDREIRSCGGQLGFKMGVTGEYALSSKWGIGLGTNLALNQGGTLAYRTGGNFWPISELKVPQYNLGPKPVPDNSHLDYHLQYWEANLGLTYRIKKNDEKSLMVALPQFGVHRLLQARGSINNSTVLTTGENIMADLENISFSLSSGVGLEKWISLSTRLFINLRYQCFISDITLNNGFKSHFISTGNTADPKDDIYNKYTEKSNTFIHSLGFRLGLLF